MKYIKRKKKGLSNVEIVLLQLVNEKDEISGYEINQLVRQRGYKEWADIGMTSIYVGLGKLKKMGLLSFYIDTRKHGKGPLPRKFKITLKGRTVLAGEILNALSLCRERDRKFDLGIAGIPFVAINKVLSALTKRKKLLLETYRKIKAKFDAEGGKRLPVHTKGVFEHPLFLIKHELRFTDSLIKAVKTKNKK